MKPDTPARKAMAYYFDKDQPGRKGNRVTIATSLSTEYKEAMGLAISSRKELDQLAILAQDRGMWKFITSKIMDKQAELRAAKVQRKAEKKKEAKRKRDEATPPAKKARTL